MTTASSHTTEQHESDDLTLRDLVLAYRKYTHEAIRHWWLYAICFLIIGGYMGYRAWSSPYTYTAKLTFMLNEDDGTGFGGVGSVLGQLGLGRGRTGKYNLDKIVELARSRRIIQQVLLTPLRDSTPENYIGNLLISEYGFDDQWAERYPEMAGFRFTRDSVETFNETERRALLSLYSAVIGDKNNEGLITASYDDLSSILSLTCKTTNEDLSISFALNQFDVLSEFYIDQAIERQQKTYDLIREKVDSIAAELSKADVDLAVYTDASNNLFSKVDQVKGQRLTRDMAKLGAMQVEAVKNLEYAEFVLKDEKPVIQELDIPISPIRPVKPSLLKALVIGAAIAFVLVSLYIFLRKIYREAMESQ